VGPSRSALEGSVFSSGEADPISANSFLTREFS
jgi:hypothetical protein